jgi:hypothetical protein
MYLKAHYLSSDIGAPEMRITRDDCHMVPEEHIKVFISDMADGVDETEAMQVEYENFMAQDPAELGDAIRAKTLKTGKGKKGRNGTGTRKGGDQPAVEPSEPDSSG